jgi:hypothetical protein
MPKPTGTDRPRPGPSITIYQHGYRDGRPVDRSTTAALAGRTTDPVQAARQARALILSGAWRSSPKTGGPADKATYLLRVKVPMALAVLPRTAIQAMTARPPRSGCRWCSLRFHVALDGSPRPDWDDPALNAFLGDRCHTCQQAQDVHARVAALLARDRDKASRGLVASANARTPRGMNSQDPRLDRIVWAARSRLRAKIPEPAYYRRGRPGEATRPSRLTVRQATAWRPAP